MRVYTVSTYTCCVMFEWRALGKRVCVFSFRARCIKRPSYLVKCLRCDASQKREGFDDVTDIFSLSDTRQASLFFFL